MVILINVLYADYHLLFIFLNQEKHLYINQLQVDIQLNDLHIIYHLYCNTLRNKLNLMLRNCVRYKFCLDKMVSSKLHAIKERDMKKDSVYYESSSVFSKEKGSKKYKLLDVKVPDINAEKTEFYIFDKNTVPVPR